MACDMCGKKGDDLVRLRDGYQTPEVKDVCNECRVLADKELDRLRTISHAWVKKKMQRFVSGGPPPSLAKKRFWLISGVLFGRPANPVTE